MRRLIASSLLLLCALHVTPARAEEAQLSASSAGASASGSGAGGSALDHWWLGGYYRHLWVPGYMTDPFFSRAPSIATTASAS